MQVFDLSAMVAHPYSEREKNVFYQAPQFKLRIIELPAGGAMPVCEMTSHVLFYVVRGEAEVQVNRQTARIREGQCLVSEPATMSMKTAAGVKILGIQIASAQGQDSES
jgi:quercetin dioxygenase-like cupin family protein